jgi:hypothetical protein
LLVTFSAKPNKPGQNVFTIQTVSNRRPPPAEISRVIVRLTYLGQDLGRISADATEIEPGVYRLGGSYFSLAGPWHVDVAVRRKGMEDSVAQFNWTVAPPGEPRPVIVSNRPWGSLLTTAAMIGLVLVFLTAAGAWLLARLAASGRNRAVDKTMTGTTIEKGDQGR